MTVTTRLAVLTLMVGFVVEGVGEAFEFVSKQYLLASLPNALLDIYYIGPATTVVGFLFAFTGRHEWSELHRKHVIHGHKVLLFAIALLGSVVGVIALFAFEYPQQTVPTLLPGALGVATAIGLESSFVSYLLIGLHLTTRRGKVCLGAAVAWGAVVSTVAGYFLALDLPQVLRALRTHSPTLAQTVSNLTFVTTVLFLSYLLLAVAYHDAYRQLQRGILPPGHTPAKKYRRPSVPSPPPAGLAPPASR